ncbi:MAG TPA: hypothetical protein PLG50_15490 [bacterium]|nr:hypothetical protein [bacterium]HQG47062.1 hypothetical protein [bacterium]HQI50270.1 hypothetical protein [bacterium]HQJ64468.1 hypothetical protein [bacterium]
MAKQPRISPGVGLILLFIGITALIVKSGHGSLFRALLGALFFLLVAAYFAIRSFTREENWWLVLPAGLCFTVALISALQPFSLLKPGLFWVVFLCGIALTLFLYDQYRPFTRNTRWARQGGFLCAGLALFQYLKTLHFMDPLLLAALFLLLGGVWLLLNKH